MKTILEDKVDDVESMDMNGLIKAVKQNLEMIPDEIRESSKAKKIVERTLSNLGQIVTNITEIRNAYGTGHGKLDNESGLKSYHTRLVVNSGVTLAKFLTEVSQDQKTDQQSVEI